MPTTGYFATNTSSNFFTSLRSSSVRPDHLALSSAAEDLLNLAHAHVMSLPANARYCPAMPYRPAPAPTSNTLPMTLTRIGLPLVVPSYVASSARLSSIPGDAATGEICFSAASCFARKSRP